MCSSDLEEMWRQGVPAIPCYHCGEPEEALYHLASQYPKIALGGMVAKGGGILSQDQKWAWLEQCFARVWPKRIHGFGVSAERMVYGLPFHSVDATNWEIGPCAFGNWQKFGSMSVRGSNQDLRSQIRHYLDMEARARVRWRKQMAELEALPPSPMRLGRATSRRTAGSDGIQATPPEGTRPRPEKAAEAERPARKAEASKPTKSEDLDPKWQDYWKGRFA